jgi:uncharacterized protein YjbI with pentapeptide repeats
MTKVLRWFEEQPRPAQLLLTVAATLLVALVIDGIRGWDLSSKLFFPQINDVADVRFWSALVYGLVLGLGLPVAFLIWHWRDRNIRDQIEEQRKQVENQRKDINLKEFQEVQLRAAGALDGDLPQAVRDQLQIAALHQLRGFLRGEYGEAFKRPAFELLMAGHANAMNEAGTGNILAWVKSAYVPSDAFYQVQKALEKVRKNLDQVALERMGLLSTEWEQIRSSGFPLVRRNFDLLNLDDKDLSNLDMRLSSFIGTQLGTANLVKSQLFQSVFIGANLTGSDCTESDFVFARMDGASISHARFFKANLSRAKMFGVEANGADFIDAELVDAQLRGARLNGVHLDADQPAYVNSGFLENAMKAVANEFGNGQEPTKEGGDRVMQALKKGPMPFDHTIEKQAEIAVKLKNRGAEV